jgi:hypothetical protein
MALEELGREARSDVPEDHVELVPGGERSPVGAEGPDAELSGRRPPKRPQPPGVKVEQAKAPARIPERQRAAVGADRPVPPPLADAVAADDPQRLHVHGVGRPVGRDEDQAPIRARQRRGDDGARGDPNGPPQRRAVAGVEAAHEYVRRVVDASIC